MPRIRLIAASDDFLLEERLAAAVDDVSAELGGVEPEVVPEETTPESIATELVSPSLFAADRLLVVRDARTWLGAPPPAGDGRTEETEPDVGPLLRVLENGVPEGVGLVIGAWCGRKPSGKLVDALKKAGEASWIPLPPPPKPWEDAALSREQRQVLEGVVHRAAGEVRFSRRAMRLLLERLGFAPRLLVQEVRKLTAAVAGGEVDEALVRRLVFPRERSLEVVRDAVLDRRLPPLLDLIAAAASGSPVNDWQGRRIAPRKFGPKLLGMVSNLQQQMLYLRRLVAETSLADELDPAAVKTNSWYAQRFKNGVAPRLLEHIDRDAPSPLRSPSGRPPKPFALGGIFRGAAQYTDAELVAAIATGAAVESELRLNDGDIHLEPLTVWLSACVGAGPR